MDKHPDVKLYYSYKNKEVKLHLHIVPMTTPLFPHGLELARTFSYKEDAEFFAEMVQNYIDAWKKHI